MTAEPLHREAQPPIKSSSHLLWIFEHLHKVLLILTTANNMDRWPIFSSPSACGCTTEKEYTSPDLSAASSSSSARLNTREVQRLTTNLRDTDTQLLRKHLLDLRSCCEWRSEAAPDADTTPCRLTVKQDEPLVVISQRQKLSRRRHGEGEDFVTSCFL